MRSHASSLNVDVAAKASMGSPFIRRRPLASPRALTSGRLGAMPALLTTTSIRPWRATIASTAPLTAALSDTSNGALSPPISVATASAASAARSFTTTRSPSAANRRQMAAPNPLPPPVTSTMRGSLMTTNVQVRYTTSSGRHTWPSHWGCASPLHFDACPASRRPSVALWPVTHPASPSWMA